MHRITHPMMPFVPTDEQCDEWMTICSNLIMASNNNSLLLEFIITGDKTWCFSSTHKQSMNHQQPNIFWQGRSKKKVMLQVFLLLKSFSNSQYPATMDVSYLDMQLYDLFQTI
jgi:hypothetical protein